MARLSGLLAPLLLFAGVVGLYAPSLGNGFVYDDHEVIRLQPAPRGLADLAVLFAEPHFLGLPYWRPVTRASLLAQKGLHGDRPGALRLVNAALLGAAALLAVALLRTPALGVARRGPAWLAAGLFAAHPVASACVLPIASGRETLLPAVLILACVLAWLRGRRGIALATLPVALLAKEQAAVVPVLFLWADLCGVSAAAPAPRASAWLRRHGPAFAIVGVYLLLRGAVLGGGHHEIAVWSAPLRPLLSYVYALQVWLAPFGAVVYEPGLAAWLSPGRLAFAALALLGLGVAIRLVGAPPARALAFWAGWFVVVQLPTANLLRQEAPFAERYAFLAGLALPALAAGAASAAWGRVRPRRIVIAATALVLAWLAVLTLGRAPYFRDDVAFATQWLRSDPGVPEAHHLLAVGLAERGDLVGALVHYDAALERAPDSADLHANRAAALALLGRDAEARAGFAAALARSPEHPEAHLNLAKLLVRAGRPEPAARHAEAALRATPRSAEAHRLLGGIRAEQGRLAEATEHLRTALALDPGHRATRDALRRIEAQLRGP